MSTPEPHREEPEENEESEETRDGLPGEDTGDGARTDEQADAPTPAGGSAVADSDADIDAEFARIVAAWEHESDASPDAGGAPDAAEAPEPASPERDAGPRPSPGYDPAALDRQAFTGWTPAAPDPTPPRPRAGGEDAGAADQGWRAYSVSDEEDHFIPPPPPPLPAGDLGFWGIVAGLVLGPLILVLHVGFGLGSGSFWPILGGGLCLLGVALLILRLPRDRDPHDRGNGAQV